MPSRSTGCADRRIMPSTAAGHIGRARGLLESSCTSGGGQSAHLWQAWACLESRQRNHDKARELFDAALAADSQLSEAYHAWGVMEMRQVGVDNRTGSLPREESSCERARVLQGNLAKAQDLLVKGLRAAQSTGNDVSVTYAYSSLGQLCERMGKLDEARRWYSEGTKTKLGSNNFVLWSSWALLESQGGTEAAQVRYLFGRALDINPRHRHTYLAAARFEAGQGNKATARELFQRGENP